MDRKSTDSPSGVGVPHLKRSGSITSATSHPHKGLVRTDSSPKLFKDKFKHNEESSEKEEKGRGQELDPKILQSLKFDSEKEKERALLWAFLASYLPEDKSTLQREFVRHCEYTLAQTKSEATDFSAFQALSSCTRDRLIERWKDTKLFFKQKNVKQVNYMSLEFLLGRSLQNSLSALGLVGKYADALMDLGFKLEDLYDEERDAGLGNGGLGRLAACFMDSLATCNYPGYGYGLRYKFGMFYQTIVDGEQIELPDYWLNYGSPWEIERLDVSYPINFYGKVVEVEENGKKKMKWEQGEQMLAVAYDYPIPGFKTYNTVAIRLWSSKPSDEFNLESFNKGDYLGAIEDKEKSENITNVLYPNDNTMQGKELRLKQQYLFVSATIQDIISQFKETGKPFKEFSNFHAIQLNDTHPTLGIPELMRILIDEEDLSWDEAWDITQKTFSYTNHTVLPEALEKWSVSMVEHLLPRHIQIIYEINERFLKLVDQKWPGDVEKRRTLSIIDESHGKNIKMASLAIVGSHTINGVAYLHSELVKHDVFPLFYEMWPKKFQNKTNGVTPRRWIQQANPDLSELITRSLNSDRWLVNLDIIKELRHLADNSSFQKEWMEIKRMNKIRLAEYIERVCETKVNVDVLFDVHVKRFHEYKRQLLNILGCINRYLDIKEGKKVAPRVVIFGGKAAPGYYMAKLFIKLINSVASVVNNDPKVGDLLKIVFIPNYCVSNAEIIIPASDISQHISTAGTEASGTSNMKFSMNGGLIIGTLDGANIEIRDAIGHENMYIFGARSEEVNGIKKKIHDGKFTPDPRWERVLLAIKEDMFGPHQQFQDIINSVSAGNDHYIVSYDFASYLDIQNSIDADYKDKAKWAKKSIMASVGCGTFSSDRTIREYAENIWNIEEWKRPGPVNVSHEEAKTLRVPPVGSPNDVNSISMERLSPLTFVKQTSSSPLTVVNQNNDKSNVTKPKQTTKGFNVTGNPTN
ncbi:glycogen phosphorylase 2 [Dictyostelium purpureum]|uniref:Alpha-1,4 glucan phosphorylase n=1 Tax=Dictyostelium purpureum TaxID=5786 RepID=F0ZAW2_DICPU|nr:glycogen phosphorylase 2 [Dictyostelium purpureum]EGC38896.1 glycogen phosphorylase 2 [Dictyostelium purpureum]|eukprot:XP_003284576.1 glycogen phosphorylase 2 [Dictyostelium purpureum]